MRGLLSEGCHPSHLFSASVAEFVSGSIVGAGVVAVSGRRRGSALRPGAGKSTRRVPLAGEAQIRLTAGDYAPTWNYDRLPGAVMIGQGT